jgi:hypothetical protein
MRQAGPILLVLNRSLLSEISETRSYDAYYLATAYSLESVEY